MVAKYLAIKQLLFINVKRIQKYYEISIDAFHHRTSYNSRSVNRKKNVRKYIFF